eukprot:2424896-Rhodomonas_salina.1
MAMRLLAHYPRTSTDIWCYFWRRRHVIPVHPRHGGRQSFRAQQAFLIPLRCPVLTYEMPGTGLRDDRYWLLFTYAMPSTCLAYAMPDTDLLDA